MTRTPHTSQRDARRPYRPYGAAIAAWRSARREVLMAGPAGTGKSRAHLEKLHFCADKYPNMRGLIVRKTRASITQSAMVTYEEKVLPEGWLGHLIHFHATDQQYEYPNGSIIAIGGLDKASKIMSSEWDIIYVQEATELTEEDWEALTTRLRNNVMPYQQLIADCNPSYPTHWLKRRCDRGVTLLLESHHEDNPSLTPGYIATLDALTGVRKLRLRYGKWAAAEGMVYEQWDHSTHIVTLRQLVNWGILRSDERLNTDCVRSVIASVDWGFTNPGVLLVWAIDGDRRAYLVRQLYRTRRTIDWWIREAEKVMRLYGIEQFVCDPSEPSYIEQFNQHDLPAIGAVNDIAPGISAVQAGLKVQDDGRARFYVYEYALKERDESRELANQPYCLEQEVDEYVYPTSKDGRPVKEVPVKVNDHAVDALRYMAMYLSGSKRGDIPLAVTGQTRRDANMPVVRETDDEAMMNRQRELARMLGSLRSFG